jgi:hypothetical protein
VSVSNNACVQCAPGFTPEYYDSVLAPDGGSFCKYQQAACDINACTSYQKNTKYENLQCQVCQTSTTGAQRYSLNSASYKCDKELTPADTSAPQW